jgi:hypothetical protein
MEAVRPVLDRTRLFALFCVVSCSGGSAGEDPYWAARTVCREAINGYREKRGLAPLYHWKAGDTCADGQMRRDAQLGQAHGSFGRCREATQNECPGWSASSSVEANVVACLEMMLAEGPGGGHYENMMSAGAAVVSCGFYKTPEGALWMVQNFR